MPTSESRRSLPARVGLALAAVLSAYACPLSAQVPTGQPQQLPSPEQAQSLLKAQPELGTFQFRATNRWIDGSSFS